MSLVVGGSILNLSHLERERRMRRSASRILGQRKVLTVQLADSQAGGSQPAVHLAADYGAAPRSKLGRLGLGFLFFPTHPLPIRMFIY